MDPSQAEDPMSCVMAFRSRGWSRDLEHIVSCYYLAQVGPLDKVWLTHWLQFAEHMHTAKDEWVDIKELTPLQFMPYVQRWFQTTTGIHLRDLDRLVEWIRASGYYHWKVANLGQLHLCPHLRGQKVPKGPLVRPSIRKKMLAKRAAERARKAAEAASRPRRDKPATQGTQQRSNARKSQQGSSTDKTQQSSSSREVRPSSSTGRTLPSSTSKKTQESPVEAMDIGGSGDSRPWEERVQEADQSAKRRHGNSGEAVPATPSTTKSSAKATPFPIASRVTREEGAHAIFGYVKGISACPDNIATRALRAAFPDWDDRKITTWSNQLLYSISEYQLACVTRGAKYCAPLLPEEIEAKLPPLADYLASDRRAVVDVRPKDNRSRALRVAVWLHSLDQNLVGGEDAAASLHLGDHRKGLLLNHFLSPGMSYLRTEDVFARAVEDNWKTHQEHKKHYTDHLKKALPQRTELKQSLQHKEEKLALAASPRNQAKLSHQLGNVQEELEHTEKEIKYVRGQLEELREVEPTYVSDPETQAEVDRIDDVVEDTGQSGPSPSESAPADAQSARVTPGENQQSAEGGHPLVIPGAPQTMEVDDEDVVPTSSVNWAGVTPTEDFMQDKEDPAVADNGNNISVAGDMANLQLRSPKPDVPDGDAASP